MCFFSSLKQDLTTRDIEEKKKNILFALCIVNDSYGVFFVKYSQGILGVNFKLQYVF